MRAWCRDTGDEARRIVGRVGLLRVVLVIACAVLPWLGIDWNGARIGTSVSDAKWLCLARPDFALLHAGSCDAAVGAKQRRPRVQQS